MVAAPAAVSGRRSGGGGDRRHGGQEQQQKHSPHHDTWRRGAAVTTDTEQEKVLLQEAAFDIWRRPTGSTESLQLVSSIMSTQRFEKYRLSKQNPKLGILLKILHEHSSIKLCFCPMCSKEENHLFLGNWRKVSIIKDKVAATGEACGSSLLHNNNKSRYL